MLAAIIDAYRRTRKPHDIFWNRFVARPLAAVLLVPLRSAPVTPNQITLGSLVVFAGSMAMMVLLPGWGGLVAAAGVLELAYVLDCVDGQLARWRGTSSPVGAHLDFLMDELKAFLLVPAVGLRLWRTDGDVRWLLEGLGGVVIVAAAISLTTFMRRPEYAAACGKAQSRGSGDYGDGFAAEAPAASRLSLNPLKLALALGHLVVHYPSYILVLAVLDRIDIFLHAYVIVNAAYAARSLLGITLKLGGKTKKSNP